MLHRGDELSWDMEQACCNNWTVSQIGKFGKKNDLPEQLRAGGRWALLACVRSPGPPLMLLSPRVPLHLV